MSRKTVEVLVGIFMIVGLMGLSVLAFKVSGLTELGNEEHYELKAEFDNIGDLKVRAPVTVSGVTVGRISSIILDEKTFRARVTLLVNKKTTNLPSDTSARILTQGLLGSNYISLTPGFEEKTLKPGGMIQTTHSAVILENLVGQLMFNLKGKEKQE